MTFSFPCLISYTSTELIWSRASIFTRKCAIYGGTSYNKPLM